VGDTGIHIDAAHLHFQMRENGEVIDPMVHLAPYLIAPQETYRGQMAMATMPARWREVRQRLRAARREQRERDSAAGANDDLRESASVSDKKAADDGN